MHALRSANSCVLPARTVVTGKRMRITGTLCAASIVLGGCSSKLTQPEEYSGYLGDYSHLTQTTSPSGASVMRWVEPNLDVSQYDSFYIEPSQFYPVPSPGEIIPHSTLQGISDDYDRALKHELGKSLPVVTTPGSRSIIVRPAITAVSTKVEGLHFYEVIPVALVAAAVSAATGIRDRETSIATEAVFLDAADYRVLAQLVRKGSGQTLENDSQVMRASDVKKVLDGWAVDINQSYLKFKQ